MKPKQPTPAKGPKLEPYQIVIRPIVTEKGTHQSERHNAYTFEVHPQASKAQIKNAVQELFDVVVVSVRTQNRKGKPRRYRMHRCHTPAWKRAIVSLSENDRIAIF